MGAVGATIEDVLQRAKGEAVLVAPFMKARALAILLEKVSPKVEVRVYTRWRPEEIALGVSDLQVADLVQEIPRGRLFLVANLHGKLYCGDNEAVVTSANVSGTALGWHPGANLELCVCLGRSLGPIKKFEAALDAECVPATAEIRAAMEESLAHLPRAREALESDVIGFSAQRNRYGLRIARWMPSALIPGELFALYLGQDHHVSRLAADDGYRDLEVLAVPRGLTRAGFDSVVRGRLLQHRVLSNLRRAALARPVSEVEGNSYMDWYDRDNFRNKSEMFRIAARWLAHFFRREIALIQERGHIVLRPTNENRAGEFQSTIFDE